MKSAMKIAVAALCAGFLASACGELGRPPVSSTTPSLTTPAGTPAGRIVLTASALRAGKRLALGAGQELTADDLISRRRGGWLGVVFGGGGDRNGTVRVQAATLTISKNSICGTATPESGDSYRVTMKVRSGATLDDIDVEFTPDGMGFSPAAELTVLLLGKVDPGNLAAHHVSGDGSVTRVPLKVDVLRGVFMIRVEVPGFSRYSWDDGGE